MSDHGHGSEPEVTPGGENAAEATLHIETWEGIWLRIALVMVVVFVLAIIISATAFGISVPGATARMDPATLSNPDNPFSTPGLRELAPGKYEAYVVAQTWMFLPDKIEVPQGAEVTFYVTARDVIHGFKLAGSNVNVMALPGQVATLSHKFDKPGDYNFICHEYCGYVAGSPIGHHTMYGVVTVLPSEGVTETATITN